MKDPIVLAGTVRVDSSGKRITTEAGQPEAFDPPLPLATACFELRAQAPPWVFRIQVFVNLNVRSWDFVGGEVRGDICTDVNSSWKVINGFFRPTEYLMIEAQQSRVYDPPAKTDFVNPVNQGLCHQSLAIFARPLPYPPIGHEYVFFGPPIHNANTYAGNFFFADEYPWMYPCTILFKGWNACW